MTRHLDPWRRFGRRRTNFAGIAVALLIAHFAGIRPVEAQDQVADTSFSVKRGFFDSPFSVAITTLTPGATIKYTTDGSRPSPTHGQTYSAPISISQTTVLRAMAYKTGMLPTNIDTQTYIFPEQVIRQPATIAGWPNNYYWVGGSGYNDAMHDYEMDPAIVDDPKWSGRMITAMKAIPTLSIVMDKAEFWQTYDGTEENPCSVEIIYPYDPQENEQTDGGLVPHSHLRLKRSLRLHFKREYGDPKFSSRIFSNAPLNDDTAAGEYDRIVLRAGNNRSWARIFNDDRIAYTRDQWYRDSQVTLSGFGSRGTFVHLYVNGLYWGLYNPCERPDGWFTSEHFNGPRGDWFSVSHGGTHGGDSTRWDYLRGALKNKNMSTPANYAELTEYLDVATFCDYLILTWMTGMTDWPRNNWWAGNRNIAPQPLMYFGWDCEWAWDTTAGSNQGAWVHPDFRASQSGGDTLPALWHSARRNSDFMTLFHDRVYRACFNDGALTDDNSRERWAYLNDFIRDAILGESAKWGDAMEINGHPTRTPDDWQGEVDRLDGLMNGNVARLLAALRTQGFYPSINPPLFQDGATALVVTRKTVPAGFQLRMVNPNGGTGTIRYTTDNLDPRASGGGLTGTARDGGDDTTITINETTVVKARIQNGAAWSALHEAVFFVAEDMAPLGITEIMYNPAPEPVATGESISRIVGDAGGDDFGRGRVELGPSLPPADGEALFVTGNGQATDGVDPDILTRLQLLGYNVTIVEDETTLASDADGKSLIVISETIASSNASKFAAVAVPIVCSEAFAYDALRMAPANGQMVVNDSITITNAAHPLAGGLSGTVRVTDQSDVQVSVVDIPPSPNVQLVATLAGDATQAALFGFEAGVAMDGGFIAPARRAGFFFSGTGTSPGDYLPAAWTLFDAAVRWADPPAPEASAAEAEVTAPAEEIDAATLATLAEEDKIVIRGAQNAANNGTFDIEYPGATYVVIQDPLVDESPTQATADLLLDGDRFEFVELKNSSTNRTLNLSGVTFTEGIEFTFPDGTTLGPGQFAVIAVRPWDFDARYPGVLTDGQYFGHLDNGGERLELAQTSGEPFIITSITGNDNGRGRLSFASLPAGLQPGDRVRVSYANYYLNNAMYRVDAISGTDVFLTETLHDGGAGAKAVFYRVIRSIRYNDRAPWPTQADGAGRSLVPENPNPSAGQNDPNLWRPSAELHGSPGADDPQPSAVTEWKAY